MMYLDWSLDEIHYIGQKLTKSTEEEKITFYTSLELSV